MKYDIQILKSGERIAAVKEVWFTLRDTVF
jgi:hypothetical protein